MATTIPFEIKVINQQLINHFGLDTSTGQPMWRVVFSDDQFEKRKMIYDDKGARLLHPEVREVPKYRQWIQHKWVLENLVVVPEENMEELAGLKVSYEPIFPFESNDGTPLFPTFDACKFVVDAINAAKGNKKLTKPKEEPEAALERVNKLHDELFGDENSITDALAYGEGVGYTGPSKIEPVN